MLNHQKNGIEKQKRKSSKDVLTLEKFCERNI
jgi:hypothetical protein